jgi:hypothetical protein
MTEIILLTSILGAVVGLLGTFGGVMKFVEKRYTSFKNSQEAQKKKD